MVGVIGRAADRSVRLLLLASSLLFAFHGAGCASPSHDRGARGAGQPSVFPSPPRVSTPAPVKRLVLKTDPAALPQGARAHFPAYDGDPIFVTLPPGARADVSATEVLQTVINPVVKSMGLDARVATLAIPSADGVKQPRADFKRLAQVLADEYERNPKLERPKTKDMLAVFLGRRALSSTC